MSLRQIGKYRIIGLLGRGGMGVVYKALLPVVEKVVAVKLLKPNELLVDLLGEEEVEQRFLFEAKTLGSIRHDNIAGLLDFDRDDRNRPFFVMEYFCRNLGMLLGETEAGEAAGRLLPPEKCAAYLRQVLSAVNRMHLAGIVHRDLKPLNVLLTDGDAVKLIDFGMSRLPGRKGAGKVPTGLKIGTPYYAAPEQEDDPDKADARSDLYSCGVMAWRMFTGRLPAQNGHRIRPGSINAQLGQAWDAFLQKATAGQRSERFHSAQDMLDGLEAALLDWQGHREAVCHLKDSAEAVSRPATDGKRLRSESDRVHAAKAQAAFGLDELWQPGASRVGVFAERNGLTVKDRRHGLLWQQSGSPFPLNWEAAATYIAGLNDKRYAGWQGWRLPTIPELLSLIKPRTEPEDLCLDPLFDFRLVGLWSCDTRSDRAAWFVDTGTAFVGFQDKTCRCFVRAVVSQP